MYCLSFSPVSRALLPPCRASALFLLRTPLESRARPRPAPPGRLWGGVRAGVFAARVRVAFPPCAFAAKAATAFCAASIPNINFLYSRGAGAQDCSDDVRLSFHSPEQQVFKLGSGFASHDSRRPAVWDGGVSTHLSFIWPESGFQYSSEHEQQFFWSKFCSRTRASRG